MKLFQILLKLESKICNILIFFSLIKFYRLFNFRIPLKIEHLTLVSQANYLFNHYMDSLFLTIKDLDVS